MYNNYIKDDRTQRDETDRELGLYDLPMGEQKEMSKEEKEQKREELKKLWGIK